MCAGVEVARDRCYSSQLEPVQLSHAAAFHLSTLNNEETFIDCTHAHVFSQIYVHHYKKYMQSHPSLNRPFILKHP